MGWVWRHRDRAKVVNHLHYLADSNLSVCDIEAKKAIKALTLILWWGAKASIIDAAYMVIRKKIDLNNFSQQFDKYWNNELYEDVKFNYQWKNEDHLDLAYDAIRWLSEAYLKDKQTEDLLYNLSFDD